MNENVYTACKKTSTQNLECSQRQIHTVHANSPNTSNTVATEHQPSPHPQARLVQVLHPFALGPRAGVPTSLEVGQHAALQHHPHALEPHNAGFLKQAVTQCGISHRSHHKMRDFLNKTQRQISETSHHTKWYF